MREAHINQPQNLGRRLPAGKCGRGSAYRRWAANREDYSRRFAPGAKPWTIPWTLTLIPLQTPGAMPRPRAPGACMLPATRTQEARQPPALSRSRTHAHPARRLAGAGPEVCGESHRVWRCPRTRYARGHGPQIVSAGLADSRRGNNLCTVARCG